MNGLEQTLDVALISCKYVCPYCHKEFLYYGTPGIRYCHSGVHSAYSGYKNNPRPFRLVIPNALQLVAIRYKKMELSGSL